MIVTMTFLSPVDYFTYANGQESVQEQSENEQTEDNGTLEIKAETFEGKSNVKIKQQFSLSSTDREIIIDEIIKRSSLSTNATDAALELTSTEEEKDVKERFEVNINVNDCISKVTVNREFILDSTERERILDAVTKLTLPTKGEIERAWELEIDEIKIIVNVEKGKAKVQIGYCDQNIRFILNTSDENSIISAINEKTGLREYKIPQIWRFQTDVVEEVKRPKTPEEIRAEALERGEEIFENAQDQLTKTEKAQEILATGKGAEALPDALKGGGCLIATATFGSEMAPQVQSLREIRDDILLQTQSGTTFMTAFNSVYYSFSPAVAELEKENPMFKEVVKVTITPLLTSLSILNYVDIDSEAKVLFYGIGVILLNIGMYFVAPIIFIDKSLKLFKHKK